MTVIRNEDVEIVVDGSAMRVRVDAPQAAGKHPGILMYSDIFQLTGPQVRVSRRLAGYGFVVASPEIYHRVEAPGTTFAFDDDGRTRGLANARATSVASFDADARAVLDWLRNDPRVRADCIGAVGFCIGGHLAFRAALQRDVRATACFYPTGLVGGQLGKDADAGSLARVNEIHGELLMVFGARDPHVPEDARTAIASALRGARATTKLFDTEHAFMRDEGPRYDPEATDAAWLECIGFLRRVLGL